ncbi:MAG: hypothetical protein NTV24_01705 [Candidatus Woesebacteria bacterium]|nr:hypothetical protein [Candidatus Woesebacteria bacterium]
MNTAKTIAKQIAQEPWEILKDAGEQVFPRDDGREVGPNQNLNSAQTEAENKKLLEERDKVRSQRLIEALQTELRDRTKNDLIKALREKIAKGEVVYIENYPQLTPEEKEFLKKQIEMVKIQNQQAAREQETLAEPASKKGRRLFNFGKKTQVQRQQTQTERPLPPSG